MLPVQALDLSRAQTSATPIASPSKLFRWISTSAGVLTACHIFIANHVLRNDGADHRRAAIAAVDVYSHPPGRGRVEGVSEILAM